MHRSATYLLLVAAAALVVFADSAVLAQGCAMCKTAIGGVEDPLSRGINASIYFMMGMPFALFAAVGGWLAYACWSHGAGERGPEPPRTEREAAR